MGARLETAAGQESDWLDRLRSVHAWATRPKRIVLLSPHPDDEVLGAGGFLADQCSRGIEITVVAASDGEAAYVDVPNLASIRRAEQDAALQCLGIGALQTARLGLPDGDLASHESQIAEDLRSRTDADTLLLAPWEHDCHPDHEACGRAAKTASAATRCFHASYFFWAWHQAAPDSVATLNLRRFELSPDLRSKKRKALLEYGSQLHREDGDPILPMELLHPALRSFEVFAIHADQSQL